ASTAAPTSAASRSPRATVFCMSWTASVAVYSRSALRRAAFCQMSAYLPMRSAMAPSTSLSESAGSGIGCPFGEGGRPRTQQVEGQVDAAFGDGHHPVDELLRLLHGVLGGVRVVALECDVKLL